MWDPQHFITDRLRAIDASGIRRVFDLGAKLCDPINLSIGQPDFDVPQPIKDRAARAIAEGFNRYTQTQGIAPLVDKVRAGLREEFPQMLGREVDILISSGVSGGLLLAMMTCVQEGDEVLIADPYFVMYKHLVTLAGGKAVYVDTYPDFQLTAERVAARITPRTKLLLVNSPSNPTGVVLSPQVVKDLANLCEDRGILLLSDEIYDQFCHEKVDGRLPSPADTNPNVLLMRGFSKTYGMTGWRLGYVAGPAAIVEQMTKLQQYSFVCAPSMVQLAGVTAMDVDMNEYVEAYRRKRDLLVERLSPHFELVAPGGAFYAFPKVPEKLGLTATQFVERAIERNVLIIPGSVFSERDTHFRISYACDDVKLEQGLDILIDLAKG